ncbi:type-F conjugative transfer system pilin assembly protein TrbC [Sphingomonas sp. MG17]|uniref:Type-F conjugative transfer system pilin assembly protein TrbC n=1 Tax=Sphingomonas tagetis TaxID=2949092 RepID=A0A9X2HSY8_9SPHN|nr:type-F conjugative transfer system pilin assembly protein TrbC [Sphingomonas tagetis]MCP3731340.1 type-F conjugative transfer system pilin assembly protein TrbC [Sphingomonas tagetis]
MPISTPSASSALAIALALAATAALAQDSAKSRIEREGAPAMKRVQDAIGKTRERQQTRDPKLPAPADAKTRQRAFEGLRRHPSSPEIEQRAKAARAAGEAAMAAQRELMAKRLRAALGLQPGEVEAVAKAAAPPPSSWVPVLFVSSSMPLPVLRAYAAQLERVRGVLAFRGMPGGLKRAGPMARLSAQILRIDPGCEGPSCAMRDVQLIVDPLIFRQHGVARVPALAMVPVDPTQPYCERDDESPRANHIVYGDAALSGLAEEYRRIGGGAEVRDVQALLGGA